MVQLNPTHATSTETAPRVSRRALIVARYHAIKGHGTRPPSTVESAEAIRANVHTRSHGRRLAADPIDMETGEDTEHTEAEVLARQPSRLAFNDDTAPARAFIRTDAILNSQERSRLRLEMAIQRDGDEWKLGRAMAGWLLVVS